MDAISALLITKALDGLSMRSIATAQNIANINSPSFRPVRVEFEAELRAAADAGSPERIAGVTPTFRTAAATGLAGQPRLDLELATASTTAMRYAALVDLLDREMQISRTVIKGGQ